MTHETRTRIAENSNTVVLLIHGILGTPHQFDILLPAIPHNCSFVNLLLDGHGGQVDDFAHSSMQKWEEQVRRTVDELAEKYERILIVGHSMGTLLAIENAVRLPEKIKGLFLISPPTRIGIKPLVFVNVFKVGLGFADENNPVDMAAKQAYSMPSDRRLWKYIGWIPRFLELFCKIAKTRKLLPDISVPILTLLCRKDELVSLRSAKDFADHPAASVQYLPASTHFTYSAADAEQIRKTFSSFFDKTCSSKGRASDA